VIPAEPTGTMSTVVTVEGYDALLSVLDAEGWSDGLPVVPPTTDRVSVMVTESGRRANEIVGSIPPAWGEATVEKLAINAVMAGCLPKHFRVIIRAIEAMLEPRFNLLGVQATTHPVAPLVLVSGPAAGELGINSGVGAFGPGWRANATVGRAVRLILMNLGGARPGTLDLATMGSPAKYTYCVGENESDSPWEPYRVDRGFDKADSVVFVAGLESPHNINDHGSTSAEEILTTVAGTMATGGNNHVYMGGSDPFLFLCPEHAQQIGAGGFSRRDVQEYLFEHARVPIELLGAGQLAYMRHRHRANERYLELHLDDPHLKRIPLLTYPTDLNVVVLGGAGKHSMWAPSTGGLTKSVARVL
jgi:hypothetical protein